MKLLITGAGGMIGRKLAERLATDAALAGQPLTALYLVDVQQPPEPKGDGTFRIDGRVVDVTLATNAAALVAERPDVIIHLAAVVSGEAEQDFRKGYRVNFDGTRNLLDAIHAAHEKDGYCPRFVFASSVAVFGQPFPDMIGRGQALTPLTSYGTQKAMAELLIADHARRGHIEGITVRLPTIVIRPGKPNAAASGFFSSILREPIAGKEAVLPVEESVRHWFASPRAAIGFLVHAAALPVEKLGPHESLDMPGVSATIGEMIEALERVVGPEAVALIKHEKDSAIAAMIDTWPKAFDPERAVELGFEAESNFDAIIRAYLEDDAP